MKLLALLLVLGIPRAAPDIHSIKFLFTASSQVPNFPEFVAVTLVDEVQVTHYDSNTRRLVPKQELAKKFSNYDPKLWDMFTDFLMEHQQWFKANTEITKQRFNQTGGVHIYQRVFGCEWNDETDEVNGFNQDGYDGEDFISFDMKTETWIAQVPQAVITKHNWDNNKALIERWKHFYTKECPDWLKTSVTLGSSSLMRKELPSVSLLQKTPSSPVTCHATGFYPDRGDLFWKRDEEELHEDVVKGEILPNPDGTFQMSVDLDLSSVPAEDWRRYSCVFHLAGVKEDVLRVLDERDIMTNRRDVRAVGTESTGLSTGAVVGIVLGVLAVLVAGIIGLVIWKKQKNGFKAAPSSETSSSSGEDGAQKRETGEEQSMLKTSA